MRILDIFKSKDFKLSSLQVLISLILFCIAMFIFGIFDAKAESYSISDTYVPTSFVSAYYENNNSFDASSESYDMVKNITLYNEQFYTPDWNSATTNITPKYYYFLRGIIPTTTTSSYFSFIFYSPYDLDIFSPSIYVKDSGNNYNFFSSLNLCSKAQTQTEGTNIFYICSFTSSDIYPVNTQLISYGLDWSGSPSSTVFGSIYDYAISPLYSFTSDTDRVNFNTTMVTYFSSQTTDDPNGNPNDFSGIYQPVVDTNDWNNTFDVWNNVTSFGTTTPVSNLVALPITFLSAVNNTLSVNYCNSVNYITLYNYTLVLPCPNLSQRLGSVWTTIDLIFSLMLIFSIGKSLVKTFARLSDMDTNIMYECYSEGMTGRSKEV